MNEIDKSQDIFAKKMSHSNTLTKLKKSVKSSSLHRRMPQISCTIDSDDMMFIKHILKNLVCKYGEKFTFSEIIRLMIKYAKNHPHELEYILKIK